MRCSAHHSSFSSNKPYSLNIRKHLIKKKKKIKTKEPDETDKTAKQHVLQHTTTLDTKEEGKAHKGKANNDVRR